MRKTIPFCVLCLLAAAPVFADTVFGTVQSVSPVALNVVVYDQNGQPFPNVLPVKVDSRRVKLEGIRSVNQLDPGDPIRLDIRQNADGSWQAASIEELPGGQGAVPQQGTAVPQSNPLWNALTSPEAKKMAKQGVLGAVTGAVSAGASGGEAGEGALIGGGIGAAASLVEDILSRPAPQAPPPPRSYYQDGAAVAEDARRP